jgi:hypothetical protein
MNDLLSQRECDLLMASLVTARQLASHADVRDLGAVAALERAGERVLHWAAMQRVATAMLDRALAGEIMLDYQGDVLFVTDLTTAQQQLLTENRRAVLEYDPTRDGT